MAEYLEVLGPLLAGKTVKSRGEDYHLAARLTVPHAPAVPLLVAALGTRMLHLAGRLTEGTITWMCGPATLGRHIEPKLRAAAIEANLSLIHI